MEAQRYFKYGLKRRLAEEMGVDDSSVKRWIAGEIIPEANTAIKLEVAASKLGLDIPAECWLLRERFPHPGLKTREV